MSAPHGNRFILMSPEHLQWLHDAGVIIGLSASGLAFISGLRHWRDDAPKAAGDRPPDEPPKDLQALIAEIEESRERIGRLEAGQVAILEHLVRLHEDRRRPNRKAPIVAPGT